MPVDAITGRHLADETVEVTNTAAQLSALLTTAIDQKCIKVSFQNLAKSGEIFISMNSGVTSAEDVNGGWVLQPRDSVGFEWPKGDVENLYFISDLTSTFMKVWQEMTG